MSSTKTIPMYPNTTLLNLATNETIAQLPGIVALPKGSEVRVLEHGKPVTYVVQRCRLNVEEDATLILDCFRDASASRA
jgi:hypothetical protein